MTSVVILASHRNIVINNAIIPLYHHTNEAPYHTIFANNSCGRDESDALEVLLAIFSTNGGIVAAISWY